MFTILVWFGITILVISQAQNQQQSSTTLTKNNVDALLEVLSATCRLEMEAALNTQAEITIECKEEIQEALISLNIPLGSGDQQQQQELQQQQQQQQQQQNQQQQNGPQGRKRNKQAPSFFGISPIYSIALFVVLFISAIAGLVAYVNSQRASVAPKKVKKLSKKKV
jgi:hypothetical protein